MSNKNLNTHLKEGRSAIGVTPDEKSSSVDKNCPLTANAVKGIAVLLRYICAPIQRSPTSILPIKWGDG